MDDREFNTMLCAGLERRWPGAQAIVMQVNGEGPRGAEARLYERRGGGWAMAYGPWPAQGAINSGAGRPAGAFLLRRRCEPGPGAELDGAVSPGQAESLRRWLDYDARPVLVQGMGEELERLMAEEWGMLCLPPGWGFVDDYVPDAVTELHYATADNFTSRPLPGYLCAAAPMRLEALRALAAAADGLRRAGLRIRVFDAYRPQRATDAMLAWAQDEADTASKAQYYPGIDKRDIPGNYIARRSSHRLGGAVDLTLLDRVTGGDLDMGGPFDFFGDVSAFAYAGLTRTQAENRARLRSAMAEHGFEPYEAEWWHFSYPVAGEGGEFDILPLEHRL